MATRSLANSVGPDARPTLPHPNDQQRARRGWGRSLATGADYGSEYYGSRKARSGPSGGTGTGFLLSGGCLALTLASST